MDKCRVTHNRRQWVLHPLRFLFDVYCSGGRQSGASIFVLSFGNRNPQSAVRNRFDFPKPDSSVGSVDCRSAISRLRSWCAQIEKQVRENDRN
jgi:hypothetical protein